MEIANITLRLLTASQILLFFLIILWSANPPRVRLIACTFALTSMVYLVRPLLEQYLGLDDSLFLGVFPSLAPSLILLFVWVVFEEESDIPWWILTLFAVDIVMSFWASLPTPAPDGIAILSQSIKIFMASMAIYQVWCGQEHDLVEMRLKARLYIAGALAITVLGVAIAEIFLVFEVPLQGEVVGMAWMFLVALMINVVFVRLNPTALLVGAPVEPVMLDSHQDPVVTDLLQRMTEERLYSDHDLRVGTLAEIMGIPEYQLRKKINQSLGYRNFNQFVNRYRIEEAGERLANETRTPVLSIALDVGFRSISSFNTAFQKHFGVSPTGYRAEMLSNS